jgi:predicted nucleic acid-binding protein
MTPVVVDASALAAIVFHEPDAEAVARRLEGVSIAAPTLLKFELAHVAWKKTRRASPNEAATVLRNLGDGLDLGRRIAWHNVDHSDVVLIATALGISTYDASYVWLAGWLGAELVTLDAPLEAAVLALSGV